jgi:hypothetical protein
MFLGIIGGTYETNKLLESHAAKIDFLEKAKNEALTSEQQGLVKARKM